MTILDWAGVMCGLILCGMVAAGFGVLIASSIRTWGANRPQSLEECAGADLDGSTYRPCGRTLTARQAHVLTESWDEGQGAGSGVSITYCGRHCPGGCLRGCKVARV